MMFFRKVLGAAFAGALCLSAPNLSVAQQIQPLTVFAAASLKDALDAANAAWVATGKPAVRLVLAGSGTLARQIEQGAPADVFISADDRWMDWLVARNAIRTETRRVIARNGLVVIASSHSARLVTIKPGMRAEPLHIGGKIVVGDVKAVPAGTYAKAALESLHLWEAVEPHLVRVENVRVALALVARGEAMTGIVYATDAAAEPKVRVIGTFPANLHPAIRYPAAAIAARSHADALPFLDFLAAAQGQTVLARFGFLPPG